MYVTSLSLPVLFIIINTLGKQTKNLTAFEAVISKVQADVEK